MVKYHFITFATPEFMSFAEKNVESALSLGKFDTAKIYTMADIDHHFKAKNEFLFKHKPGSCYYIWKPYIILKHLLEIPDGDVLCYNDSKYLWLKNVRTFEQDILKNKNIGIYANKPNDIKYVEKHWTKFDAYCLMNLPIASLNNVKNTPQAWAGFILLRNHFNPVRFVGEWLTYTQDTRISSDIPSLYGKEDETFIENRHDQTCLSLLAKKWGIEMHTIDKTYMINVRKPV
jgi:hypothetical protein